MGRVCGKRSVLKRCCTCKRELPVGCFGKWKGGKDGLKRECKECCRAYYDKNIEQIKIKKHEYYLKNRKELYRKNRINAMKNFEREREYHKKYRKEHRERICEIHRDYYSRHPEKFVSRRIFNSAVKRGEVKRLDWCQVCGKAAGKKKTEAHHADYSLPLDVVWLCKRHHSELHAWLNGNEIHLEEAEVEACGS